MGIAGLKWSKVDLPLSVGLHQRADDRARPEPALDICRDVQFDEDGGLQTRLPYGTAAGSIFGGGSIANARRIERYGTETVLFTDTAVYSWNAQLSAWVLRGTHLAVKVTEAQRFVTTGDQIDGDRAELSGTIVYAWTEGSQVYAAAIDKTTSSVLVVPTAVSTAIGRPRLVALATKILLFVEASTTLLTVRAIDPAVPATAIGGAGTTVLATDYNLYYDVVRAGTQDLVVGACRRQTTTSYTAFTVTPALAVTTSTKARTADGPLAVATIADGTQTQVVRGNSTNVQGDLLTTSTLADVFTAQAIGTVVGTPINQIAAAFASTTCTVFWDSLETSGSGNSSFATKSNTVTTGNVVGTQAFFVRRIGIGSRAFEHGSRIFVWLAFGEDDASVVAGTPLGIRAELQNTYFLYRDDGLIVAKATSEVAGGYSPATGHLPGVTTTSATGNDYAWCGASRRIIDLSADNRSAFGARSPRDIAFSFDSNEARRCAVLGRTLYISGGLIQQYDGFALSEVGFLVTPWSIAAQDSGAAGNVAVGTYNWKGTIRFVNGQGEQERSTTATGVQLAVAGASHIVIITYFPLYVTNKLTRPPSLEFWRTAVAAAPGVPYYLITGQDPTVTTGDNPYIPNAPSSSGSTFNDNFADATLTTKETNPENDGTLENLAPPAASIIIATDTRLFLAGVAGDPHRVWYSKQRNDGEVAAFHDSLVIDVPRSGGDITSIAFLGEVLYVFRRTAIYALPGTGFDNGGGAQNFGPARIVSLDVGAVSHESVALTPLGLVFKSSKGWQMLRGNEGVEYIGDKVSDFDAETVLAVNVVESQYQVRILSASRLLVWDYRANQWGEDTITDGVHATMFGGVHVYLAATGTRTQATSYSGLTYGADVETTWNKPAGPTGAAAIRKVQTLGEYRSAHLLRLRMAYNYDSTYVDDVVWSPSPTTVGGPLQFVHGPRRNRCESFKVRLTAVAAGVQASLLTASGLSVQVTTSGTAWAATWAAKTGNNKVVGELGNTLTLSIGFESGSPNVIDVRDDLSYSPTTASWTPSSRNIGVRVVCAAASLTVAALEAAIAAGTAYAQLSAADATPAKTINAASMAGQLVTATFSGGTFTAPTGEALKLTSLGLEVGIEPGLYRRLPAAQKA
jgi:hypothetical protein